MANDELISSWTGRLRTGIPDAVAILLKGSFARGEYGPYSDIDFDVLVHGEPREEYLAWFVEHENRLVHVSAAVDDVASWMTAAGAVEPWAFGLPAAETTRLLWASDHVLCEQLNHPARMHPPGEPELEDLIEAFAKVRNAKLRNDELALRLAAQTLANLCPSLLRLLNPDVHPSHRYDALVSALAFPVAPEGYRDDLLLCLGLTGSENTTQDIHDAAERLTVGTVHLLREHAGSLEGAIPKDLYGYLVDGTLNRYVAQLAGQESRREST